MATGPGFILKAKRGGEFQLYTERWGATEDGNAGYRGVGATDDGGCGCFFHFSIVQFNFVFC